MGIQARLVSPVSEDEPSKISDAQLIANSRAGDETAFEILYLRHYPVALSVARQNVDRIADAEDVASEAFADVMSRLKAGVGPEMFFRSYLLTAVTRIAYKTNSKAMRIRPTDNEQTLDDPKEAADPVLAAFESQAIARAFKQLPERWQAVLWYIDVEGLQRSEVAATLGITPNAVSNLIMRARKALRTSYLQSHLTSDETKAHHPIEQDLGSYVDRTLRRARRDEIDQHLAHCAKCSALVVELNDIRSTMRSALVPLVTGLGVTQYASLANSPMVLTPTTRALSTGKYLAKTWTSLVMTGMLVFLAADGIQIFQQPEPAASPTVTLSPSTIPAPLTTPARTPTPRPASSDSPSILAPIPTPTPAPPTTSTPPSLPVVPQIPTPTPTLAAPSKVIAQITSGAAANGSSVATVSFKSAGSYPITVATVTLALSGGRTFQTQQPQQASGWSCALESASLMRCQSQAADSSVASLMTFIGAGPASTLTASISGKNLQDETISEAI